MTTATMKPKVRKSVKPSSQSGKASAPSKRGRAEKKSPWISIIMFLFFAGLVAYMFSPNVPNSQGSGSKATAGSGFANSLAK